MKGIVFNLLEEIVCREHGEDTWDELLDTVELDGAYTSLGTYDPADLFGLVGAAAAALGQSADEIVRWFGRGALPIMAAKYPEFFTAHTATRPFVLTLNDIIHPEVRKLYPGADVPVFDFDISSSDVLVMGYQSPRKLCSFAEGLIEGAAAYFSECATIEQVRCMKRGDEHCLFHLSFAGLQDNGRR